MSKTPENLFDRRWQKRLSSQQAGEAWRAFLNCYSGLLLSVIRRYHHNEQWVNDAFLFVCERLVDNSFHRLRQWKPRSDAAFGTWLRAVTANLCIDFNRHEKGRIRAPRSVQEMGALEQRVFHCRFGQRMKMSECLQTLQGEFPGLSEVQLAGIIGDLNNRLESRQHWNLKVRQRGFISLEDPEVRLLAEKAEDETWLPERHAQAEQESKRLQAAMARLSTEERLLLRLRFEQNLPFREVALVAGLKNAFQARYLIDKALDQLARILTG